MSTIEETFPYSDYTITEGVKSKIDPDVIQQVETGFGCPRCKAICRSLGHDDSLVCGSCGLQMCLHGNALTCVADSDEEAS